jgi:hypothetical protein
MVVAFAGMPLACGSECRDVACKRVDLDPRSGDFVVELDTETALVFYQIDEFDSDQGLAGGQIVFRTDDPECMATPESPCTLELARLRLELGSMTQPTNEGDVQLERLVLAVETPVELVNRGSKYELPAGAANVQTCVTVDGRSDSAGAPLEASVLLSLDLTRRSLALDGVFPVRFGLGKNECVEQRATASVLATGVSPWAEAP